MPTNVIDLCTLADVKSYLAITDTTQDVLLQTLITAVSQFFASYCGRVFQSNVYNERYNGTGGNVLPLNQSPVTAVASVSVNGVALAAQVGQKQSGYTFDEFALYSLGTQFSCAGFTTGLKNVWVTYTAGYVTIPYDLNNACVQAVAKNLRDKNKPSVASRAIAGESITYTNKDLPAQVFTILELYQRSAPLS